MSSTTTMGSKKYICKFCKRNFPCGRSLGGHIRSHLIHNNNNSSGNYNHQPKLSKPGYELRENPKKTKKATKLFNSSSSSWSNESGTDPSSINKGKDIGKRSSFIVGNNNNNSHSSLSEVVEPEEDEVSIAMCLIMLSRDVGKWGNVSSCEISDDILLLQPQETKEFVFDANGVGDTCKKSKNVDFSGGGSLQNGSKMKNNIEVPSNGFPLSDQSKSEEEDENLSTWNLQGGLKLKGNNQNEKPPLNKRKNNDDINSNKKRYEIATNGGYKNWSKMMEFEVCEDNEMTNINKRSRFECTTCNKVFHSYQALGGHRASHKRLSADQKNSIVLKVDEFANGEDQDHEQSIGDIKIGPTSISSKKVVQKHECPFCFRTFSSGQALGGHKRSHMFATNNNNHAQINLIEISSSKTREFLDLNLPPAHIEEDITTTTSSSSNSHAELIKPYWWVEHPKHEPSLSLISN